MTQRFNGMTSAYPVYWLDWLDNDDFLEFCQEFLQAVRDVLDDHADQGTLADVVYAWQQTAFALRDPHLSARFAKART